MKGCTNETTWITTEGCVETVPIVASPQTGTLGLRSFEMLFRRTVELYEHPRSVFGVVRHWDSEYDWSRYLVKIDLESGQLTTGPRLSDDIGEFELLPKGILVGVYENRRGSPIARNLFVAKVIDLWNGRNNPFVLSPELCVRGVDLILNFEAAAKVVRSSPIELTVWFFAESRQDRWGSELWLWTLNVKNPESQRLDRILFIPSDANPHCWLPAAFLKIVGEENISVVILKTLVSKTTLLVHPSGRWMTCADAYKNFAKGALCGLRQKLWTDRKSKLSVDWESVDAAVWVPRFSNGPGKLTKIHRSTDGLRESVIDRLVQNLPDANPPQEFLSIFTTEEELTVALGFLNWHLQRQKIQRLERELLARPCIPFDQRANCLRPPTLACKKC